jgi:hypothetical protein
MNSERSRSSDGAAEVYDSTANGWSYVGAGYKRTVAAISAVTTGAAAPLMDYIYFWSGSTIYAFTMPTAVGNTNRYTLKNGSTVSQTVTTTSSQTIDGSTTITLRPNTSVDLISNSTNWLAI